MDKKIKIIIFAAIVAALVIFLYFSHFGNFAVLNPKGIIAQKENQTLITAVSLMMLVVIPMFFLFFFFAWRYRDGNSTAKYQPNWNKNKPVSIILWLIPITVIFLIGILIWKTTHELDPYKKLNSSVKPITIQVVSLNWKWLFIYPEQNIATVNFIEFPVNTPVNFELTGTGPMNTFWIPQLSGQVYAMAGMENQLHIMASQPGQFNGSSAEIDGKGYAGMKFKAVSVSEDDYNAWLKNVKASSNVLNADEYAKLSQDSENNPTTLYSSVQPNLFSTIIMKFMMPDQNQNTSTPMDMEGMQ